MRATILSQYCCVAQRDISLLIELEHPNVLKVMEYIVDADTEMVYIVTEYAVFRHLWTPACALVR